MTVVIELSSALVAELAKNDGLDPRDVPLRFSTMKLIAQSPAHYLHAVRAGYDETLSMRLGTGTHAILFGTQYVVWSGRRGSKAWDAFESEHADKPILTQSEYEKSLAMADALKANPTAARLLFADTKLETRIDWEWQGRAFRSTPDAAGRTHLVDLKCLRSADPEKIKWQSRSMGYHVQAAVYRRALNQTGRHNIKECYLVVVESKPPYPVTVLRFANTALEAGDRTASQMLERVLACEASGDYPGYTRDIVELDLPITEDDLIFDNDDEDDQ